MEYKKAQIFYIIAKLMFIMTFFVAGRGFLFIFMSIIVILIYAVKEWAKRGKKWEIRKLPAIEAIEEGIGRAVELGRPVHFSAGGDGGDIGDPDRATAYSLLTYTARLCAERGCRLIATVAKAEVLPVLDSIMKEAAVLVGDPAWYRQEDVRFLGEDANVYVGAVMGLMAREQVACNLFFGYIRGSWINIYEAGHSVGAIQIGGISRATGEIGFCAIGCDYFLMLEEVVAGSAYVSGDRDMISTVAVQDYFKFILLIILVIGSFLYTANIKTIFDIISW